MTEEEIKSLIRNYIVEHLDIRVDIKAGFYSYDHPFVRVSLYLDDELLCDSSDTLPQPKVTY